jgi:hypothetical protein
MRNKNIILLAVILFAVISVTVKATVFEQLSYQGKLTDSAGNLINGSTGLTFKIYYVSDSGSACWQKDTTISIQDGIVNVILGPISVCDPAQQWWLGIKVSGDPSEMSPRIKLTAVPYSMNADLLDGQHASAFSQLGNSIESGEITDGTIVNADISASANISASKINDGSGSGLDADLLDGQHASVFSQLGNSIESGEITDGTIQQSDLGFSAGTITGVWGGNGLTGGASSGEVTLHVGAGTGISVSTNAVGLASNYADGSAYDGTFVNEGQPNCIISEMIVDGDIQTQDLSPSIQIPNADKWDGHDWGEIYPNADMVDGYHASSWAAATPNTVHALDGNGNFRLENNQSQAVIHGRHTGNNSYGLEGIGDNNSGGVYAKAWDSGYGVYGESNSSYGVYGKTSSGLYGVRGENSGSGIGVKGYSAGSNGTGVYGECNNGIYAAGIVGRSTSGCAGWFDGTVQVVGNFYVTGTKSSVVSTSEGRKALYALEGEDVEFYASGSGRLTNGFCEIVFEDLFRESISSGIPIKVIVTPTSSCNGLFVSEKNNNRFRVQELLAGNSNATFDWIAIGRRKGYEVRPNSELPELQKSAPETE